MEKLFNISAPFHTYPEVLAEPIAADRLYLTHPELHIQYCYQMIHRGNYPIVERNFLEGNIAHFYFIYTDFGKHSWENKYWFVVGKLCDGFLFFYEASCGGCGFGYDPPTASVVTVSESRDLLLQGLTERQRELITSQLQGGEDHRFVCASKKMLIFS